MGTDIINTIEGLNARRFSDYEFLINDLKPIIFKYDRLNNSNLMKDLDLEGYYFKSNSINYINNIYNEKLEEFITNFFWNDELIRNVLSQNPDIINEVNRSQHKFFYPLSQGIEGFSNSPNATMKMMVSVRRFESNYKSGYYQSSKSNSSKKYTSQNKKEGCFVATFAYDSYEHNNVLILREFRDNVLVHSIGGSTFIKIYYKYSPSLVSYFKMVNFPKSLVKIFIKIIIRLLP
jgi:hypothetical protein